MRRVCNIALLFAVALMWPPVQAQTTPQPTPETASTKLGSITGRVLVDGQAVNNASIVVTRVGAPRPSRFTPTNDNGDFEAKGLEAGVYQLTVSAPGYVASANQETYHRAGDFVTLTMQKGGVITGKVLNAADEPVIAVRVRAIRIRDEDGKPVFTSEWNPDRVTDDRGVYRLFGLRPGTYLVAAGGRGLSAFGINGYDHDAPTYAPSSTRDTATAISLAAGEEKTIDIHYRNGAGYRVSGSVNAAVSQHSPWISIMLARFINGVPDAQMSTYQNSGAKGFEFNGVEDGDYMMWAQYAPAPDNVQASDPRRITVKGADVTGIVLDAKPLASIAGEIILIPSTEEACKGKRQPSFNETVIAVQRKRKPASKAEPDITPHIPTRESAHVSADQSAGFVLRNLVPGQYEFAVRFFANDWYLQSISQRASDLARSAVTLKSGERATGVKVTLAGGAASLSGQVERSADQTLPVTLFVYLVPAEKEKGDEPLRYSVVQVDADGSFALEQVAPGRYWLIAKVDDHNSNKSLRSPDAAGARVRLRREAESAKAEVVLEPCRHVTGHKLVFK